MHKNNKRSYKKHLSSPISKINVFLVFATAGIVLLGIVFMVLPFYGMFTFTKVYHIFYISKQIIISLEVFVSIVIAVFLVFLGALVNKCSRKKIKKIIIALLPLTCLFLFGTITVVAGTAVLETHYLNEQKEEENDDFEFDISSDNLLFNGYQASDLRNHKGALKNRTIELIKSPDKNNINGSDANFAAFEKKTSLVHDYEEAYIVLREKKLFENECRDERTRLNNTSIYYRLEANYYYKDSANQNLLMDRYNDSADELYSQQDYAGAIEEFSSALKWGFTSVVTAYEESNGISADVKERIGDLYELYEKISNCEAFPQDVKNKAEIFAEVLKDAKNEL